MVAWSRGRVVAWSRARVLACSHGRVVDVAFPLCAAHVVDKAIALCVEDAVRTNEAKHRHTAKLAAALNDLRTNHTPGHGHSTRREPSNLTPTGVNSVSFGPPHVRPTGRTWGEPTEIKKNTQPENIIALSREQAQAQA